MDSFSTIQRRKGEGSNEHVDVFSVSQYKEESFKNENSPRWYSRHKIIILDEDADWACTTIGREINTIL